MSIWYNILHYSVISSTIKQDPTLSRIPHIKSSYRTTAHFSFTRIFPVSTRQPDITIRSVRLHYRRNQHQVHGAPHTRSQPDTIKKPIGQYKPMDCITHGSSQITPCHCIVYLLLWSASYQQSIPYHYITFTADTTIIFF